MDEDFIDNTYFCRGCGRLVDPDVEPSAGEPNRCQDCDNDVEREEGALRARDYDAWANL